MEIASPLPISHTRVSTKRPYVCSPGFLNSSEPNQFSAGEGDLTKDMEVVPAYVAQPFKRRRFTSGEFNETSTATFPIFASSSVTSSQVASSLSVPQPKRLRTDHGWNQSHAKQQIVLELQRVVDQQAAEIERLKTEKETVEKTCADLNARNEKCTDENRILKRAVTIQQERQNHALSEIEAACKYRNEAEERIRKLEQMNLTLQFHLQQKQSCNGNNFMGFSPRPPDIY